LSPLRVLLVDDNPDDRLLVRRELLSEFSELADTQVADEEAFRGALEQPRPDVILTDYNLRWTSGLEVLQRARECWPHVPVIMLTSTGTEEVAVEAMKRGLDDYILKSATHIKRLPAAIRTALERTESRQRVEALEERYRKLMTTAPIVIYICSADPPCCHYVSPYVKALLGYEPESLLGRDLLDLVHVHSREVVRRYMERTLQTGEPFSLEHRVCAADGSVRWVRSLGMRLRDPVVQGDVLQGLMLDITDAVQGAQRERAVSDVSRAVAEARPGRQLESALEVLQQHIPFTWGFVAVEVGGKQMMLGIWPTAWPKAKALRQDLDALHRPGQPPPNSITSVVFEVRGPIVEDDVRHGEYFEDEILARHGLLSWVAYPVVLREGFRMLLMLHSEKTGAFRHEDVQLLGQVTPVLAGGVESHLLWKELEALNRSLEQQVQERTAEIAALYEMSQEASYALAPDALFDVVAVRLLQLTGADVVAAAIKGPSPQLSCRVSIQSVRPLPDAAKGRVFAALHKSLGVDPEETARDPNDEATVRQTISNPGAEPLTDLTSLLSESVQINDVRVAGIVIASEKESAFTEDNRRLLGAATALIASSMQRIRAMAQAERSRLQEALDAMREGVVLLDGKSRIVAANPAATRLLRFLGKDAAEGTVIEEVGGVALEELRQRTLQTGSVELRGESGHHTLELLAVDYTGPGGAGGTALTLHDVTELREYQRRLDQQARLAALGQLAGGVAHDFNNILTTMIGLAQLSLSEPLLSPQLRGDLEEISKQGQRAAHLVRQILDFGRRSISQKTSLQLDSFIKELSHLLGRIIPENIEIRTDIRPGRYLVYADPTQIQQVVMNLATNCRDAMPGGGTLTLRMRELNTNTDLLTKYPEMARGRYVLLAVEDTGHGMSPDVVAHAFEPFFTTKGVGEGTGLGLAQAYGIVKQHDGHIYLESEPDKGTAVLVYLPALVQEVAEEQERDEKVPRGHGEMVLVAEDEDMVRTMTGRMLERLGYQVLAASSGEEALGLYKQHQGEIAVVVVDMVMPKMSGVQLFDRLREADPQVRIIAMTGYGESDDIQRMEADGLRGLLQKPFRLPQLGEALHAALEDAE